MRQTNPYKKGSKEYKAYDKGFKDGYKHYLDIELKELEIRLESIRLSQMVTNMVNRYISRY